MNPATLTGKFGLKKLEASLYRVLHNVFQYIELFGRVDHQCDTWTELLGRVALVAQRPIVVKLCRGRSVGPYVRSTYIRMCVRRSVRCIVEKTADRIRMPFGIIGRTGPGMRHIVGIGDLSTGRGTFGGEFGARHCNQWGLYDVRVRQLRDAALFPNYFGQTFDINKIT